MILEIILTRLNTDSRIVKLANRKTEIPYLDDYNDVNDYWYPHPPAFIPLFLGHGASYKGLVKHFFMEREVVFADYFLEWNYMLEKARNADQLFTLMILEMIMLEEGITDRIRMFANDVAYERLDELLAFAEAYGDDPAYFSRLPFFTENTPLMYADDLSQYTGDFPSTEKWINHSALQNAAGLEISAEPGTSMPVAMPWLNAATDKLQLFNQFIEANALDKAWLTLNSRGWKMADVALSLQVLKRFSTDDLFHMVADLWLERWEVSGAKNADQRY
jgi:hypothetical protein